MVIQAKLSHINKVINTEKNEMKPCAEKQYKTNFFWLKKSRKSARVIFILQKKINNKKKTHMIFQKK